jgi:transcriptional regulator with XRE-family HTH domain
MSLLEDGIRNQIRNFGLTLTQVSELSGIRIQVLSPGLTGRNPLSLADIDRLRDLLGRIKALVHIFKPIPLGLQDTITIRFLLKKLADGELNDVLTPHARELAAEMEKAQQQYQAFR